MDYLTRVLGIQVIYKDDNPKSMPNFLYARYRFQKVTLDGKQAISLYPKTELDAVSTIKKHIERIQRTENAPAVLVLTQLTYRQREYLLRKHIPFIVDGKQIYLPFMAIYLQERCDGEKPTVEAMLPSAQLLLLYFIYHGCGELLTSDAAIELDFTPTSISRASRQLEEMELIHTEKRGVHKIIFSEAKPEELFFAAKDHFRNPVKRMIYVPKSEIHEKLLTSGYQALSEYSMLNPPAVCSFATDSIVMWENLAYRLYSICERKNWAQEAYAYNALVVAWPKIQSKAAEIQAAVPVQMTLSDLGLILKDS